MIMNYKSILQHTLFIGISLFFPMANSYADLNPALQKERAAVIAAGQKGKNGLSILENSIKSTNILVRRATIRSLFSIGAPAVELLEEALKNDSDALVRQLSLQALAQIDGIDSVKYLEQALKDSDAQVRLSAVQWLAGVRPQAEHITELLKVMQTDPNSAISKIATNALWSFNEEGISLREKPAHVDHHLDTEKIISLPKGAWKFKTDPSQMGHKNDWFKVDFNDRNWQDIEIERPWEPQIGEEYDGVAWYRRNFILPEKPLQKGSDIVFEAVDESAWVWVNGVFIGQHDIGPDGWNKRFAMDVTDVLKWGAENQIVVRVLDRARAGGIWKPVYIEVLK